MIEEWYETDPDAERVDSVLLITQVEQQYPRHAEALTQAIKSLAGRESPENFRKVLLEGQRQVLREEMIMKLADRDDAGYAALALEYEALGELTVDEDDYVGTDPAELYRDVVEGECIPLGIQELNDCMRGGPLKGQHIVLFGRPEMGKSLLALNALATAAWAGYRVGYWENEDDIAVTQMRAVQAITGATEGEVCAGVREDGSDIRLDLSDAGWYDRIFFKESSGGTLPEIRAWIQKHELDLCIINQLSNLDARERDNRTLELGALAQGSRAIGRQTKCTMVDVHQAGESAEGRRVLRMSDLEWSNTAMQATYDIMIGMGADQDAQNMGQRVLTFCKNKRGGTHDRVLVRVDKTRNLIS